MLIYKGDQGGVTLNLDSAEAQALLEILETHSENDSPYVRHTKLAKRWKDAIADDSNQGKATEV